MVNKRTTILILNLHNKQNQLYAMKQTRNSILPPLSHHPFNATRPPPNSPTPNLNTTIINSIQFSLSNTVQQLIPIQ